MWLRHVKYALRCVKNLFFTENIGRTHNVKNKYEPIFKVLEKIGVRGKKNFFQEVFLSPNIIPKIYFLEWQEPFIPQDEQELPQEHLPFFLSLTIEKTARAIIAIIIATTSAVFHHIKSPPIKKQNTDQRFSFLAFLSGRNKRYAPNAKTAIAATSPMILNARFCEPKPPTKSVPN